MNETEITGKQMVDLRQGLRGAYVQKHSDRFTAAVPDVSASWAGYTNWIENKYLRKKDKLKDIIGQDQIITCHELSVTTNGRCWIVVYEQEPRRMTIWTPRALAAVLYPTLVFGAVSEIIPVEDWASEDIELMVRARGAVRIPGWHHAALAKVIRDATRRR